MPREKIYLTPEQTKRLKDLESDIEWLREEIRRAEYVGIDIVDLKERFDKATSIRARMLEEYTR